jgi:hypothetical protein
LNGESNFLLQLLKLSSLTQLTGDPEGALKLIAQFNFQRAAGFRPKLLSPSGDKKSEGPIFFHFSFGLSDLIYRAR